MSRSLRARKSQPNYAVAFDIGDDDEPTAGPSKKPIYEEEDSGSDFAPPPADPAENDDDEMDVDNEVPFDPGEDLDLANDDEEDAPVVQKVAAVSKPAGKKKVKGTAALNFASKIVLPSVGGAAGIARTSKRQIFILPTPSVHHRHRAVPLYPHKGRVERLTKQPTLFGPQFTTPTYNLSHNAAITNRVSKSWGFNVGPGPLWDMAEDRGWYREAVEVQGDYEMEATRRPVVHQGIHVKNGWRVLSRQEATPYLPTDSVTNEDGSLNSPPPVPCFFGPYSTQQLHNVGMFDCLPNSQFFAGSQSHTFNPGAPAWGLDWCPIHPNDRQGRSYTHYLAVGPFPTASHSPEIGVKADRPFSSCIQIWTLSPTDPQNLTKDDPGVMRCAMVICIDSGPAFELKWCPLPSHDSAGINAQVGARPRKLGLLGGTFQDGSFSIFVVPDPVDVTPPGHDPAQPVCVQLPEPLIRIDLEETACFSFDWGNSELVAIGTTHGIIAVYHLGQAFKDACNPDGQPSEELLPSHYLTVHQSAIRTICWARSPPSWPTGAPRLNADPTIICSGGYDGLECITDIREGHGSIMNRTRDVINSMTFSPYGGGPVSIDHENIVKVFSLSPSMLGRGHILMEPAGPIWSLDASEYHPSLAVGSADGVCSTTNALRSTRRGGSVPFFVHKIYQMDYSRTTKEFRMLEQFLPLEASDRPTQAKAARNEKAKNKGVGAMYTTPTGSASWPREVGIQRVVWHCGAGLSGCGLLASATASGLCRVDFLWGRWLSGKVPYYGVDGIRLEADGGGGDAAVESDESE
ncbi:Pre-mRNA splicing factor [Mycena kentingensis (nom. inval.)]|nr:Pre-mRNA splicing factor [Mycena kentingensis (nom. inval.)]